MLPEVEGKCIGSENPEEEGVDGGLRDEAVLGRQVDGEVHYRHCRHAKRAIC